MHDREKAIMTAMLFGISQRVPDANLSEVAKATDLLTKAIEGYSARAVIRNAFGEDFAKTLFNE